MSESGGVFFIQTCSVSHTTYAHQKIASKPLVLVTVCPLIFPFFFPGVGTFSSVYLVALKTDSNTQFAIKYLVPTSINTRVENEIYCLDKMGLGLLCVVWCMLCDGCCSAPTGVWIM